MRAWRAVTRWPVGRWAAGALWRDAHGAVVEDAAGDVEAFPWASVTKLCTALSVLVGVEEGLVTLDEPAGPVGSTVAHLLAHASGLAPDDDRVLVPPATRRIYSNHAYRELGALIESRAEMSFEQYLHDGVLEALGMEGAHLVGADARGGSSSLAAAGLHGGLRDLLALGSELLSPRLLASSTIGRATEVAFGGLAGTLPGFGFYDPCDWGLGFELRGAKAPHWTGSTNSPGTFGHFGRSGGFLWVDQAAAVALGVLTDRSFGPWAKERWPALADLVLAEVAEARSGTRLAPGS